MPNEIGCFEANFFGELRGQEVGDFGDDAGEADLDLDFGVVFDEAVDEVEDGLDAVDVGVNVVDYR